MQTACKSCIPPEAGTPAFMQHWIYPKSGSALHAMQILSVDANPLFGHSNNYISHYLTYNGFPV